MQTEIDDIKWMNHALALAHRAKAENEVPIGAVLVLDNKLVSEGWNQPISTCDPTAHAEIIALREAAKKLGNYRLLGATLYVTLEPCAMCAGAIVQARLKRLVYGAHDLRAGAIKSVFNIIQSKQLNHQTDYTDGILSEDCSLLLRDFFKLRREK